MRHYGEFLDVISITLDTGRLVWTRDDDEWVSWGAPILVLARVVGSSLLKDGTTEVWPFFISTDGELAELNDDCMVLPVGRSPMEDSTG